MSPHLQELAEPNSEESLMGPYNLDSSMDKVGTSTLPVAETIEPPLRLRAILEDIRRSKMKVGSEGVGVLNSPLEEVGCSKALFTEKVKPPPGPLRISEPTQRVCKKTNVGNPEASLYCGDVVVSNFYRQAALSLWESVRDKIVRTPFERVPDLRSEVTKVFCGISKVHAENLTPLQEFVENYLKRVENFNLLQSSYSAQLSSTDKDHQLGEKTSRMKETLTLIDQMRGEDQTIRKRVAQLASEKEELEARLKRLKPNTGNF